MRFTGISVLGLVLGVWLFAQPAWAQRGAGGRDKSTPTLEAELQKLKAQVQALEARLKREAGKEDKGKADAEAWWKKFAEERRGGSGWGGGWRGGWGGGWRGGNWGRGDMDRGAKERQDADVSRALDQLQRSLDGLRKALEKK